MARGSGARPSGSVLPSQDGRLTQQGSEPGVGWEALPTARRPQAHKGPIVRLRLWAAGGCPVPHGEALPPAARAEEGTAGTSGSGGARCGWAGLGRGAAHTEPGLQHEGAYSPSPGPACSAWTACGEAAPTPPQAPGQCPAVPGTWMPALWPVSGWGWEHGASSEQSSPGGFLEVVRSKRGRKWAVGGPSMTGRPPGVRVAPRHFRAVGRPLGES